jgi:hypothetical protein
VRQAPEARDGVVARGRIAEQRGGSPTVMLGRALVAGQLSTVRRRMARLQLVRWGSAATKDKRASDSGRSRGREARSSPKTRFGAAGGSVQQHGRRWQRGGVGLLRCLSR